MYGGIRYNMGIQLEGIEAEQWLLKRFREKGVRCFQPDAISFENEVYIINEVKHQEFFKRPPFDGHGLPIWQINARMMFWLKTGIRCRLVIIDKKTKKIYYQWLDILESGNYIDTKGLKKRRVYPIENFKLHPELYKK